MNSSIRKIALGMTLAFVALLVNLNVVQLARSSEYAKNTYNRRQAIVEEGIKRGQILAADGEVLAESVPSGDDQYKWARRYPLGSLFGHITGYYTSPFFCGSSGLERTQNDYLSGFLPKTTQDFVDELLGRHHDGNSLKLTMFPKLQRLARTMYRAKNERGGVSVIDTHTGAIYALYGEPTYDPNVITKPRLGECSAAKAKIENDSDQLVLSRAYQVRYFPGSTFKILTASAAFELGKMTPSTSFGFASRISLPQTNRTLGNFGGENCGGTLLRAFEVSCNTTFARVGMKLGRQKFVEMAERYGLQSQLPFDLDAVASCVVGLVGSFQTCDNPSPENLAPPFLAYTSIGQNSVGVTPLQMSLLGAAVENGGYFVRPHVVARVLDPDNRTLVKIATDKHRVQSKKTNKWMRELMQGVVCVGTGTVVGFRDRCHGVGGKTGTAQTGHPNEPPQVWFVAWEKGIAVAATVEHGGSLRHEATGGKVAGPIAKALLETTLRMLGRMK